MINTKHGINNASYLRVLSIFATFDGEQNAFHMGTPSVFVRLAGCSVGCRYCDTKYSWSFKRGRDLTPQQILHHVEAIGHGITKVTITGGEPLEQEGPALYELIDRLINFGHRKYRVTMETAGTENWEVLFKAYEYQRKFHLVVDWKLDNADAERRHLLECLKFSKAGDVLKFVIGSRDDFNQAVSLLQTATWYRDWKGRIVFGAMDKVKGYRSETPTEGAFAEENEALKSIVTPGTLANWMMNDKICLNANVGLNVQLHKFLWMDDREEETNDGVDFSKEIIR